MTTEAWPPGPDEPGRVVTTIPRPGSVLVRSATPPTVPDATPVDVRPGAAAVIDGDRPLATLQLRSDDDVHRFDTASVPAVEAAVATRLADGTADLVRFGDPAVLRGALPDASVAAIRRRLTATAVDAGATLLAWTAHPPRATDERAYDVVLD